MVVAVELFCMLIHVHVGYSCNVNGFHWCVGKQYSQLVYIICRCVSSVSVLLSCAFLEYHVGYWLTVFEVQCL